MLSVIDNLSSFVDWVNLVMNEKNITQADIARTGFVTRGAVSLLLTYRIKSVGVDMCRAISAATGISLEAVYRKAGLLPDIPGGKITFDDWEFLLAQISPDEQDELRQIALMKIERRKLQEAAIRAANFKHGEQKG